MVSSHVAHDCRLGDYVILANGVALAGHVTVDDHAIVGGLAGVHQFVPRGRVGALRGRRDGVEGRAAVLHRRRATGRGSSA